MSHPHPHHSALTPPDIETPDQWHLHTPDEEERPQKPHGELTNAHLIVLFGVGSFFIVFICAVAVYAYYISYSTQRLDWAETREAVVQSGGGLEAEARRYKASAQAHLEQGFVWADHDHVQLPISAAMDQVAKQYASKSAK